MNSFATSFHRTWCMTIQGDMGPLTFSTATNGNLIAFLKAPPRCPPTPNQEMTRERFRRVAESWATLTPTERIQWETLSVRACLRVTGYDLFTYYHMKRGLSIVQTVERQTNLTVTKPDYVDLD